MAMHHAATIMIKMNQNDQEGVNGADLGLSLSQDVLSLLSDEVEKLHTGDHVLF